VQDKFKEKKMYTSEKQDIEIAEFQWNWLYKVGAVAALIAMFANILDILLGFGGTEVFTYGSRSAIEWFAIYQGSWFKGLYSLGILNLVYLAAMLPVYLALLAAHRKKQAVFVILTMIVFLVSMSIYISNNAAIPLLVLSNKYTLAGTDVQRSIYMAAGESVLARGEDFTPGSFIGLFSGGLAAIALSYIMLRGGVFGKVNAWIGIAGFSFLSIFTILATFVPALYVLAFYFFGSIGGLLALVWFALVARRLFQLSRQAG